ncbi:hypothetical protein MBT42_18465 [Streptomyces sp. MBT42]|uniref:hypothetical protein n=1 Tax=Streptomyces sp. MBT42 TaxID=1488373 RepID=UPI001E49CC18|nr:hypothetical protein [Streptomyces sp. MBT42]MCD2465541.1 hypothetical protein [Streptomyces sp. MBT42]
MSTRNTRVITSITAEDIESSTARCCARGPGANGLEPNDVAAGPGLTVERVGRRTVIVYSEFQRGADGKRLVDLDKAEAVTVRRSVTQVGDARSARLPGVRPDRLTVTVCDRTPGGRPPP